MARKPKIKFSIEKYALAKVLAGKDASKDDVAKFYGNAPLAKHIARGCSLDLFVYIHEKSQNNPPLVVAEPTIEEYGLSGDVLRKVDRFNATVGFVAWAGGFIPIAYLLSLKILEGGEDGWILAGVKGVLAAACFPGSVVGWMAMAVATATHRTFSRKISRAIRFARAVRGYAQHTKEYWEGLSWREFEIEVANYFTQRGIPAYATSGSGDRGVDVVLNYQQKKIIVQCKQYNKKVGPDIVRELQGTMINEKADIGMVISLNGFTQAAYTTAFNSKNVQLWEIDDLLAMTKTSAESAFS